MTKLDERLNRIRPNKMRELNKKREKGERQA